MSRRSVTTMTMAVVVVLAVTGLRGRQTRGVRTQTGAITGQVVDLQGHPVDGATVWGLAHLDKTGTTRSGAADGQFRLTVLLSPDKPVTVWADAPNLRERRSDVRIFPGKDYDIGRLTLLPGTRIVGRAIDSNRRRFRRQGWSET